MRTTSRHRSVSPQRGHERSPSPGTCGRRQLQLHPFEPFAARVWALRHAVSPDDAWYVALAERLDAPLATLDRRLARTADARCEFTLPPP